MNDNIVTFPAKKPVDDEMNVTISLDDDSISRAFEALRVASVGLMNDDIAPCQGGDIVHACIILISWMAKQSDVSAEELVEFFQSIELQDFDD